jgi:hypothetical protein
MNLHNNSTKGLMKPTKSVENLSKLQATIKKNYFRYWLNKFIYFYLLMIRGYKGWSLIQKIHLFKLLIELEMDYLETSFPIFVSIAVILSFGYLL